MLEFFAEPLASLLSFFYDITHSFAGAIALLTITVMIVVLPLTIKGTRSMLAMQRLGPEMKKLQEKHKNDKQKYNEEIMALYRDNKINPLSGCLPLLLQIPVFFLLYHVIVGLTNVTNGQLAPKYIDHGSAIYAALINPAGGRMESFGMDLADKATDAHSSLAAAVPFYALIFIMIAVQYVQQHQVASRATVADTPQARQMKMIQKFFPVIFGVFSVTFPAGVVLYWVISSLFRVGQQSAMYRYDPQLRATVTAAKKEAEEFLAEGTKVKPSQKSPSKNSAKRKRKGR